VDRSSRASRTLLVSSSLHPLQERLPGYKTIDEVSFTFHHRRAKAERLNWETASFTSNTVLMLVLQEGEVLSSLRMIRSVLATDQEIALLGWKMCRPVTRRRRRRAAIQARMVYEAGPGHPRRLGMSATHHGTSIERANSVFQLSSINCFWDCSKEHWCLVSSSARQASSDR